MTQPDVAHQVVEHRIAGAHCPACCPVAAAEANATAAAELAHEKQRRSNLAMLVFWLVLGVGYLLWTQAGKNGDDTPTPKAGRVS